MFTRNSHSVRSRFARKLAAYAAGAFAFNAAQVQGAIIYRDLGRELEFPSDAFSLDLDLDGINEFLFNVDQDSRRSCYTYASTLICDTAVSQHARVTRANEGSSARLMSDGLGDISRFDAGSVIDPVLLNEVEGGTLASFTVGFFSVYSGGPFLPFDGRRGYLGISFDLNDRGRVAGWVQLEVVGETVNWLRAVRIFDYAYETEPGVPILAGNTGISPHVPGDTNADGKVDLEDLNNVRNHFGATGSPGSVRGDVFPFDGNVDLEDLNAVHNNFGVATGANAVPEPPSLVLLAAGAAGLGMWRRKRRAMKCVSISNGR